MIMNDFGFIRTMAASIHTKVANPSYNVRTLIKEAVCEAVVNEVSLVVFPELSVSGYSCGDLFGQNTLLRKCEDEISWLAEFSQDKEPALIVGAPVPFNGKLYNCAIIIKDGEIRGIVPKVYLSNNAGQCESRWFSSGIDLIDSQLITYAGHDCIISPNLLFELDKAVFAVQIGTDLFSPISPSSYHSLAGAHIIATLAPGYQTVTDLQRIETLLCAHSTQTISAHIYSSASGDSSQDNVFTGQTSIWEIGTKLQEYEYMILEECFTIRDIDIELIDTKRRQCSTFNSTTPDGTPSHAYNSLYNKINLGKPATTDFDSKLFRTIERHPFAPVLDLDNHCEKILDLQVRALTQRLSRINAKAVIGISGGLDSTLALIVTALAYDRLEWDPKDIVAVTMPGFGTTSRTKDNAWDLMQALGVTCREISIVAACEQHFKDIQHSRDIHDATYENTQARERTQILMDIANQIGGIVIGTGDLSELALGWATYNGDHMSMYGVNADIPKTLVKSLVKWAAENKFNDYLSDGRPVRDILLDIVDTPISPELLPASESGEIQQVTEDLVGPYELHDFFLYNFVHHGYSPRKIYFLANHAFSKEHISALQDSAEFFEIEWLKEDAATGYDEETIKKWLNTFIRRFFSQQFKRSCMPDGPKVCEVSLSPRGGWNMASDAWSDDFLSDI